MIIGGIRHPQAPTLIPVRNRKEASMMKLGENADIKIDPDQIARPRLIRYSGWMNWEKYAFTGQERM